jgi:hypothetical protein
MKELALSLLLLLSAAAAAVATFELTLESNPNRLPTLSAPPSAAPSAVNDPQPQKSGACEAVKAEGCAL